jgi:hypothetical protein
MSEISFGDQVRIHQTPETEALGVAGRVGQVHGYTAPSVTGVVVIGDDGGDYAIAVFLEGSAEATWFAPRLLEFVDHAPGTEIRVGDRLAVPAAVDLQKYNAVVIYCERFNAAFGVAREESL